MAAIPAFNLKQTNGTVTWTASSPATLTAGQAAVPYSGSDANPRTLLDTAIANAAVGGADMVLHTTLTIAGAGNTVLDLRSFTDNLGRLIQAFARIKFVRIRLLSALNPGMETVTVNASSITIGGSGVNGNQMFLGLDADTVILKPGKYVEWGGEDDGAGVVVDATNKDVKILNNDPTNAAKVLVIIGGGVD